MISTRIHGGLRLMAVGLVMAGMATGYATAQSEPDDDALDAMPRERRERLIRERIRDVFIRQLQERVDVTPEQMAELLPVLEDLESARVETMKRRRALTLQLRGLVEDPQASPDEIERKLADFRQMEADFHAAEQRADGRLEALLSPRQQAQVLVFRDEFRQQIEARLHDLRREMAQREAMRRGRFRSGQGGPPGSREERP